MLPQNAEYSRFSFEAKRPYPKYMNAIVLDMARRDQAGLPLTVDRDASAGFPAMHLATFLIAGTFPFVHGIVGRCFQRRAAVRFSRVRGDRRSSPNRHHFLTPLTAQGDLPNDAGLMLTIERRLTQTKPPTDYEAFVELIQEQYGDLSRSSQAIARYLTQNPNDVALQSINDIGASCGVHASSLVRFSQSLGYEGFKELKEIFHRRLATAAPGFEARVHALKDDLQMHKKGSLKGFLGDLVARDMTTLQDLFNDTVEEDLAQAVALLEKANTIYLAGQLRSGPVVMFLRYVLTMLGRRVILLDADGGLATHMAKVMTKRDALLSVSFRFYAKEVVSITESAAAANVPVIAISDGNLSPLAKCATVLFSIPEGEYAFSRSLAAPMCLAQALVIGLAARLQADPEPQIPTVTAPD